MKRRLAAPQPIPYQGSKRRIASQILECFPDEVERLVEPFAGSAAVSIAAAMRGVGACYWLNDGNAPLMALWRELVTQPDRLATAYETRWHEQLGREREYFQEVRGRFNHTHDPADMLYLLARCVKAAVRYNARGEFNNTPDHRRCGARPAEMKRRIEKTAELLRGAVQFSAQDYQHVLKQCTPHDLIYLDPPYQGVGGRRDSRYLTSLDHETFCAALAQLNQRKIRYLVSYDGRTGAKQFGEPLPKSLQLVRLEINAGRSSQATLLGRNAQTIESLYLSPYLSKAIS